jgi:hypothetical protein
MFSQLVIKFFLSLLQASHNQVHTLHSLRGKLLVLDVGKRGEVIRLILREKIVILGHLVSLKEVLVSHLIDCQKELALVAVDILVVLTQSQYLKVVVLGSADKHL